METPPIPYIYAVTVNGRLKIYPKEGTAKAQITRAVDVRGGTVGSTFAADVEMWRVGEDGWELLFSAFKGTPYTEIPWKTVLDANERRRLARKAQERKQEEREARRLYEQLKARFED